MLTLQLKTTRIILINNINNFKPTTFQSTPFAHEAHRGPRRSPTSRAAGRKKDYDTT